jgi:3-(3-hydroxy-phenyl)propionate hydroxylase
VTLPSSERRDRVVVVGAGPVGLVAAIGLAQRGIPVVVLESGPVLFHDLRAGSFHPPSLEVLEPLGITEKLHEVGIVVDKWQLRDRHDGVVAEMDLGILKTETPYPYRLHLEQHRVTPIVYEMLAKIPGVEVRFSTRVTGLEQSDDAVTVEMDTARGRETLEARWVIGADGGHSAVRKACAIGFDGMTWPEKFALVSTPYDLGELGFTYTAYISDPEQWCAVFKLPDEGPPGLWRFLYGCKVDESDGEAMSDENIERRLQYVVPRNARYDVKYRSIYRVHQRVAETFRRGRVLLAGDAAHLNNPIGGFGMNAGIQDAGSLIDKLGAVWHGEAGESVLDRYVRQRREVNIEYVQAVSIRNKQTLEERDPEVRRRRLDDYRKAAADPALGKEILMKSSMIASARRAEAIH